MTQSPIVSPKHVQRSKFVSSIKINGVPILPPLITPEKRKELRRLKREAIRVEKRLQHEREMKEYVTQLYKKCTTDINGVDEETPINTTTTIGHMINQGVQTVYIQQKLCFNVQATQYVNNEFDVCVADANKSPIFLLDVVEAEEGTAQAPCTTRTTPKLIRSNSYTLDAPSPALIEHLRASRGSVDTGIIKAKACWDFDINLDQGQESARSANTDDCDIDSKDVEEQPEEPEIADISTMSDQALETLIRNDLEVTLLENATPRSRSDDVKNSQSHCALLNASPSDDCFDTSRTETELLNLSECDGQGHLTMQEFIANNLPVSVGSNNSDYGKDSPRSNSTDLELEDDSASDWNSILKKIPSAYSRHILEYLEQQQVTQTNYDSCAGGFDELLLHPEKYSTPHETTNITDAQNGATVYYSVHEDDLDEQSEQTLYQDTSSTSLSLKTLHQATEVTEIAKPTNVQVAQVHEIMQPVKHPLTREQAATILTAAARGFLIRRLMKTEKVQHLIETIKDAVICAMQLHHDTLDHIEEADVELHRRLIQQVSAACYSFHGVFFATSIQDQMACIAVDRQKKIDKLRRIASSHCSASVKSDTSASARSHGSRKFSQRS